MRRSTRILTAVLLMGALTACGGAQSTSTTAAKAAATTAKAASAAATTKAAAATTKAAAATTKAAGAATTKAAGTGSGKLTFSWWGNQVRNERTQKVLDLYTSKNPGVTFDGQFADFNDYWKKLATASAGHSLPDIIQMDYKYINQYASNKLMVDLTPYVKSGVLDTKDCNQDVLNSGKVGDGLYAICNGINAPTLFYNKTVLDKAGVTVKDNMTLDEFIAVSKQVFEKTGYKTNLAYGNNEILIEYLLRAEGVVLFDNGKMGGTADSYTSFFKLFEDGIKDGWVVDPSVFAEITPNAVEQDVMIYGSSPETMSWCSFKFSNQYSALKKAAPQDMEIGITTWPSKDPKKSNYLKPSQFFSISTDSKNPDECAKVINFLTNDVDCNNILLGERGIPLSNKVASAISPKLSENDQKIVKYINDVVSKNSSQINPPASDGASQVYDLINKLEEKVCYKQLSAADAAKQLYEQGNGFLAAKKK